MLFAKSSAGFGGRVLIISTRRMTSQEALVGLHSLIKLLREKREEIREIRERKSERERERENKQVNKQTRIIRTER